MGPDSPLSTVQLVFSAKRLEIAQEIADPTQTQPNTPATLLSSCTTNSRCMSV